MRRVHLRGHRVSRGGVRAGALALVLAGLVVPPAGAAGSPAGDVGRPAQELRLGERGPAVRTLQTALARLAYLPSSGVDGVFGSRTWHAVVAFQGWSGLPRDGVAGPRFRAALARAHRPLPWSTSEGIEIHIAQQVLLLVSHGRVERAIHVSTGANGATPICHFQIIRREPMSWSVSFAVWLPWAQYFFRGFALHEYPVVPAYAASHGCVRLPAAEARAVWQFGHDGMRVWTRG